MRIKGIQDENFQDYKKTSMFICTSFCDGKCYRELGLDSSICQNDKIQQQPTINIDNKDIVARYMENPITSAIVIGGLEPFNQWSELKELILEFRLRTADDIVIYTGFRKDEVEPFLKDLVKFSNIIVKFGRYVPNTSARYDEVLGVHLASPNQYARRIS